MRTVIIGDVHGCREELEELLRINRLGAGDRLVFVGDLVSKGPDSAGVVALLRELGAVGVRGNHDERFIRWWQARKSDRELPALTPTQEIVANSLRPEDLDWLSELPLWLELPELEARVVHGGVVPGTDLHNQEADFLLNLRSILDDGTPSRLATEGRPWASLWEGPPHIYFGHDARRGLQIHPWATGLDTGCVYGGRLTAVVLPERRLISVPAKKAWAPIR